MGLDGFSPGGRSGRIRPMLSRTGGRFSDGFGSASIKDAPSSLPLLTGSIPTGLTDPHLAFLVIILTRPIVPVRLLLDAVLIDAAIPRAPGVTIHSLPGHHDALATDRPRASAAMAFVSS